MTSKNKSITRVLGVWIAIIIACASHGGDMWKMENWKDNWSNHFNFGHLLPNNPTQAKKGENFPNDTTKISKNNYPMWKDGKSFKGMNRVMMEHRPALKDNNDFGGKCSESATSQYAKTQPRWRNMLSSMWNTAPEHTWVHLIRWGHL